MRRREDFTEGRRSHVSIEGKRQEPDYGFLNRRKVANPLNSQNWGTYFRGVDKGLSTAIY